MQKIGPWSVLPPPPDCCQICATKHAPEQPHNQQSLFYQMTFANTPGNNGKGPTWKDAMAHCTQPVKDAWIKELAKLNIIVEP
jgi:hypothetical protein